MAFLAAASPAGFGCLLRDIITSYNCGLLTVSLGAALMSGGQKKRSARPPQKRMDDVDVGEAGEREITNCRRRGMAFIYLTSFATRYLKLRDGC